MAWTYGFYNSVNGDRAYNAVQLSRMFEGLITDGVYAAVGNQMRVAPNSGMTIQIDTGRGWFGGHWANNDSAHLLTLEGSDVVLNRYCAVCVRTDDSDSTRTTEPYLKYSEFATNPVKPEMERSELVKEYCLAYVLIRAGATAITGADIEDARGNNSVCGWVTGLIEQVPTTTLYEQYKADWARFMAAEEAESSAWQAEQQADFLRWYGDLQTNLDGDVAASLTSKTLVLESDVEGLKSETALLTARIGRTSGTLLASGWTVGEDDVYLQTITVPGVTESNDVMVAPTNAQRDKYIEMGCEAISQSAGSVTFRCSDIEEAEDIAVEVIIFNLA